VNLMKRGKKRIIHILGGTPCCPVSGSERGLVAEYRQGDGIVCLNS
jgi:hypothetical protein